VNVKQLEEAAQALVASDTGLLAMDESNGQPDEPLSPTARPPLNKRKIAISLSEFLKKQRAKLALRRQGDWKQA